MTEAVRGTEVVEHELRINARPETVFSYFTDPGRMLAWMGTEATLEPRPGGACRIDITGGAVMLGEFVEVSPPRRIVFTWGWEERWYRTPPQSTLVEVTLTPEGDGTLLRLRHRRLQPEAVDFHRRGWSHYLERLAIASAGDEPGPDPWRRTGQVPVLWHLKVSNYNEKARWALDYKRVPHERRAATPGQHQRVARKLTGGTTLPVLVLNGQAIGDSTAIIEALEHRYPDPSLYPATAAERERALELEDFFDEQLGPYIRLLVLHHTLAQRELLLGAFVPDLGGVRLRIAKAAFPLLRRRVIADFGIDERSVERAYEQIAAAGARVRAERQPSGYLVGGAFTVADLSLAALVAPALAPEQFPYPQPQRGHPSLGRLRDALEDSGIAAFAREMYSRHRGRSAELVG